MWKLKKKIMVSSSGSFGRMKIVILIEKKWSFIRDTWRHVNFYRIRINIDFLKCYFYLYEIPGKDKF